MHRLYIITMFLLILSSCTPPSRHHAKRSGNISEKNAVNPTSITYTGFIVQYNPENRQPDWVDYTLTEEQVRATENTPSIPHKFMQDPYLVLPQASNDDYEGVHQQFGLTKGHMARHQDMKWSLQATQESDYYTNICPQHEKLNTKLWKTIENLARKMAVSYDSVHIICGPIFTDTIYGFIGPNHIPIPDYFFKILLVRDDNGYHSVAFVCPNTETQLTINEVVCTVDSAELMAGIDVYSYLPDKIEATVESDTLLRYSILKSK